MEQGNINSISSQDKTPEKTIQEKAFDFLSKESHIKEIKYEEIGVPVTEFNEALDSLPEDAKRFAPNFLKYLESPVIKDDFNDYGERRGWGLDTLNKVNAEAGILYKSNKISRSNLRKLNQTLFILIMELKKISEPEIIQHLNVIQTEMSGLVTDIDQFEALNFEGKKKIADKATELARAVCFVLIGRNKVDIK